MGGTFPRLPNVFPGASLMRFSRRTLSLLIVASLIPSGFSQSQEATQNPAETTRIETVLRSNSRLVVVDVVATDGKGQAIPGLKAEDFTMLENGAPQKISSFTYHAPGKTQVPVAGQLPPGIVTNVPAFKASSLNVLLMDTLNGDFIEQAYMKDQLVKYLGNAQLDRPLALFALEDRVVLLHDFTTDSGTLRKAAEKFKPPARTNDAENTLSRASAFTTSGDYHTSDRNIETTLNQLNALAKILGGYPGRKNLIWLSESFPVNLFPDNMAHGVSFNCNGCGGTVGHSPVPIGRAALEGPGQGSYKDYAQLIKKVADSLMNAQVAVYVVDSGAVGKDTHLAAQNTANDIAGRTGGRAFHNSNDLAGSMRASVEDASTYYTLEYYPENKKWDGQFRNIQIKANRAGMSLRYRDGYYALDPDKLNKDETDKAAENFSRALQIDSPDATSVQFQAQVTPPSDKSKKVVVTFHIDPRTLVFQHKEDGMEQGKVSCTVWAYAKDKEKPTMSNGDTVSANLKANEYQAMMKQQVLPCKRELELKAGTYTLRMGVLDRTTNKIGTASATVTVQ
jgi:VWFA-related protein